MAPQNVSEKQYLFHSCSGGITPLTQAKPPLSLFRSLSSLPLSGSPDMGENAILDRFKQIKPKVLICQDSYVYAGKNINKVKSLRNIIKRLPSLSATILVKIKDNPLTKKQLEWDNIMRLR